MAGSEKLYLQPILKELLDGINAAMGNVTNIVDGLGDAVGDMKDAVDQVQIIVDGVSDTLTSVQTTIETTNDKLDTLNQSIGETKQMIVTPDSYTGEAGYITSFSAPVTSGRYDVGAIVNKFSCACDGSLTLTGGIHGTSGVAPNNPGLSLIDETTGITTVLLDHGKISDYVENITFGVVAGHTYSLQVTWNGSGSVTSEDLVIGNGATPVTIQGKIYYLTANTSGNNVFVIS